MAKKSKTSRRSAAKRRRLKKTKGTAAAPTSHDVVRSVASKAFQEAAADGRKAPRGFVAECGKKATRKRVARGRSHTPTPED